MSTQTNRLIPALLPPGSVTEETVLVLTSALYFKAPWATAFPPATPGQFHTLSGDDASAQMLNRTLPLAYYEGERFVSVSVPYEGNQLGMLLVVPDEGAYESVRESLSRESFDAIVNPPQALIVSVGAAIEKPVVKNGQIVPGLRMNVGVSCDHRVVDGAVAASFLAEVKKLIEQPALMLV